MDDFWTDPENDDDGSENADAGAGPDYPEPGQQLLPDHLGRGEEPDRFREDGAPAPVRLGEAPAAPVRRRMNNELNFPPNFERLVLGCIDADFCK